MVECQLAKLPLNYLPTCFFHAGDEAGDCHLAEVNTRNAELAHIAFGAAGQLAAVMHADGAGILREFLKGDDGLLHVLGLTGADNFFQGSAFGGVLGDHFSSFALSCFN